MLHTVLHDFTDPPEHDPWQLRELALQRETTDTLPLVIPDVPDKPNVLDVFEKRRKL